MENAIVNTTCAFTVHGGDGFLLSVNLYTVNDNVLSRLMN